MCSPPPTDCVLTTGCAPVSDTQALAFTFNGQQLRESDTVGQAQVRWRFVLRAMCERWIVFESANSVVTLCVCWIMPFSCVCVCCDRRRCCHAVAARRLLLRVCSLLLRVLSSWLVFR